VDSILTQGTKLRQPKQQHSTHKASSYNMTQARHDSCCPWPVAWPVRRWQSTRCTTQQVQRNRSAAPRGVRTGLVLTAACAPSHARPHHACV